MRRAQTNPIRKPPVTSLSRLAPHRGVRRLRSRLRRRPTRSSISSTTKQRRRPTFPAAARTIQTKPPSSWCASTGSRKRFARPTAGSRSCENAQHRLEEQLQKFRQDVEFRFGDRSGGAHARAGRRRSALGARPAGRPCKAKAVGRIRSQRRSERARRAAAAGNHVAERAARPIARACGARGACRGRRRSNSAEDRRPIPATTGPTIVGSGVAMLDQPREQFNAALAAFQARQYPEAEAGFKAFLAANPAHRLTPDAVFYIGETYLQRSRPREAAEQYLKVTTDYSKSPRAPESMVRLGQTLAAAWQFRAGLRDAHRIRQALPVRVGLGEEARRARERQGSLLSARRSQSLSSADIDALFAPFGRAKALLIAVSGGPDSTALLLMAAEWAKRRGKTADRGGDSRSRTSTRKRRRGEGRRRALRAARRPRIAFFIGKARSPRPACRSGRGRRAIACSSILRRRSAPTRS